MIDKETLRKVAESSRLKLSESEEERLQKELNQILEYFSKINEIEEKGEEMYYIKETKNAFRKDLVGKEKKDAEIRNQFSKKEENYLIAPKSL